MQGLPSRARSRLPVALLINRAWLTVPPAMPTISPATYSYLTSLSFAIAMYSLYVARLRATSTIASSVACVGGSVRRVLATCDGRCRLRGLSPDDRAGNHRELAVRDRRFAGDIDRRPRVVDELPHVRRRTVRSQQQANVGEASTGF